jgi:hypothetical protein
MKKSINLAGISFLVILFTGVVFKRLHFPGAGPLVTLSIFLFVVVYLPAFLISLNRVVKTEGFQINKTLLYSGAIGVVLLTAGILSKMMHWPGAIIGLWGGIGIITLVLILLMLINRKGSEKISMISVLIVIILLSSFSFNIFRMGNIRYMGDAYTMNGDAFSASSGIFWSECEKIMTEEVLCDSTKVTPQIKNELMQLHSQMQSTDLTIGNMIEKIRLAENSALSTKTPGQKYDFMSQKLKEILLSKEGLPEMERNFTELKNSITSATVIESEEKTRLVEGLVYPFIHDDNFIQSKYSGIYNFEYEASLNTLFLWKSKLWQTEYQIITLLLNK